MGSKRGQQSFSMSFGMIFTIFLIVVFIVVAFVAIKHFIGLKSKILIGEFYRDFQKEVDDAWSSQTSNTEFKINLPSGVKEVCFVNLSKPAKVNLKEYEDFRFLSYARANVFLYPRSEAQNLGHVWIDHLDINNITKIKNPYCIPASGKIIIKKGFYDKLVRVE